MGRRRLEKRDSVNVDLRETRQARLALRNEDKTPTATLYTITHEPIELSDITNNSFVADPRHLWRCEQPALPCGRGLGRSRPSIVI